MGLDLLDVAFRIERAFKLNVSMDEFRSLLKDNDCLVDALGVDAAGVSFDSRLVRDFGAG